MIYLLPTKKKGTKYIMCWNYRELDTKKQLSPQKPKRGTGESRKLQQIELSYQSNFKSVHIDCMYPKH